MLQEEDFSTRSLVSEMYKQFHKESLDVNKQLPYPVLKPYIARLVFGWWISLYFKLRSLQRTISCKKCLKTEFITFSKPSLSVKKTLGLASNYCLSEDHIKLNSKFYGQISEIFNVAAIGTSHFIAFQTLMKSFL